MSTHNHRIDLQPDLPKFKANRIDPETGLPLKDRYRVFNPDGSEVIVDNAGNAIFDRKSVNENRF